MDKQKLKIYLEALRYKQWIKNLVVFTAPLFTGHLFEIKTFLTEIGVFIIMSLISSASYLLNDIVDLKKDRLHPIKKRRPIASGKIPIYEAVFLIFILVFISHLFAILISFYLFIIVFIFFLLHFSYSVYFKRKTLFDLFSISFSFILRALAGEVATGYHIPIWLLLTIFFLSLFMISVKRHAELVKHGTKSRPVLKSYPDHLLTFLTTTFATTTIMSYSFYTYFEKFPIVSTPFTEILSKHFPAFEIRRWMMLTIPLVVFGIARYAQLLYIHEEGEVPEKIIVSDKIIVLTITLWALIIIVLIYVLSH